MEALRITGLGHLGDGIARGPEGPVHVALALPGETVRGEIRGGRIDRPEILAAAPERVAPPCPHFGSCGGCALQHAADGLVAAWRADLVRRALAQRGLAADIARVVTVPAGSRRRAAFAARRVAGGPVAGFHARGSDRIEPVTACAVLRPELVALLPALRALAGAAAAGGREVKLQASLTEGGADIDLRGARPADLALREAAAEIALRFDLARIAREGEVLVERRPPLLRLGRARLAPPPGAFLQPTAEGEAALVAAVREALFGAGRVADLFAGCGTFALPLAEAAEVHAVEGDAAMLAALDRAARGTAGLGRVTVEARDLFRRPLGPEELARFDGAVIDPPRQGARAQAAAIAASPLARLAHVSCNPATFARDARILADAGFRLGPVTVVDQFRWSPHVELVAGFARPAPARRRRGA